MPTMWRVGVCFLLAACDASPPPEPPPPPPPPALLSLGSAALDGTGFLPLAGDVTLVEGAQGGFHVWLKYRATGMAPQPVTAKHTARRKSDGTLVSQGERSIEIGSASEGYWETPMAAPTFLCPTPVGIGIRDETLIFRVELRDAQEHLVGQGQAEATPRCPTDGQAAFCFSICSG